MPLRGVALVLLDLMIPKISGMDVMQHIRKNVSVTSSARMQKNKKMSYCIKSL